MEEALSVVVQAAKDNGVGFWQLVFAVSVVVFTYRFPELLKSVSEFVNTWRSTTDIMRSKREATQRRLDTAAKKKLDGQARRKEGQGGKS